MFSTFNKIIRRQPIDNSPPFSDLDVRLVYRLGDAKAIRHTYMYTSAIHETVIAQLLSPQLLVKLADNLSLENRALVCKRGNYEVGLLHFSVLSAAV